MHRLACRAGSSQCLRSNPHHLWMKHLRALSATERTRSSIRSGYQTRRSQHDGNFWEEATVRLTVEIELARLPKNANQKKK